MEAKQTDIRIDYSLNTSDKTLNTPLINISFDTIVSGEIDTYNSEPTAKWSAENNTLSFNLTELTRHGGSSGSLKARLKLTEGPSNATDTIVNFQTSNTTASTVNLQLDTEIAYQVCYLFKNFKLIPQFLVEFGPEESSEWQVFLQTGSAELNLM